MRNLRFQLVGSYVGGVTERAETCIEVTGHILKHVHTCSHRRDGYWRWRSKETGTPFRYLGR